MITLEEYKKEHYSIFKQELYIKECREALNKVSIVVKALKKAMIELEEYVDVYVYSRSVAFRLYDSKKETVFKARKIIKKAFPNKKWCDHIWIVDKPFGEEVIVRYAYNRDKNNNDPLLGYIQIYVTYENEEKLPSCITKNGKCGFVEEKVARNSFVCKGITQ